MSVPAYNPDYVETESAQLYATEASLEHSMPPLAEAVAVAHATATAYPVATTTIWPPKVQGFVEATTVQTRTNIFHLPPLGRHSKTVKCPYCGHEGTTKTKKELNSVGIGGAIVCCFTFWPLFWVPLICKEVSLLKVLS